MKIYTKKGDDGTTGTLTSHRVSKGDKLIRALGALDETIAAIGLVRAHMGSEDLKHIQVDLYDMMGLLASHGVGYRNRAQFLEKLIDEAQATLPELRDFIIPGTSIKSALLHIARTTCRRAEQELVTYAPADLDILPYVNRLSDYLFTLARVVDSGNAEIFAHAEWVEKSDERLTRRE